LFTTTSVIVLVGAGVTSSSLSHDVNSNEALATNAVVRRKKGNLIFMIVDFCYY
jgi:exopolysaccharide biosynthesis protein